jgi:hypothetical protein
MKSWQLLSAVTLVSLLCAPREIEAASIQIRIDGMSVNVPLRYEYYPDRPGGYYEFQPNQGDDFVWQTGEGQITLTDSHLDPDPSLLFGSVALDFGGPSNFSYTFILPLAPTVSNPSVVSDSFSGSVTNGPNPQLDGGVTVTARMPPAVIPEDADGITEMQVYTLSDDGGSTWKNVGLDVGMTEFVPLGPSASGLTASYNEGPIPTIPHAPNMPWTHMRADVNFQLSGGGDIFTFNGAKVLESVIPEPGTLLLAVIPLSAVFLQRRFAR